MSRPGTPACTRALRLLALAAASLANGACSPASEVESAVRAAPTALSLALAPAASGAPLLEWSFDGGAPVPATARTGALDLDWGAAGVSPRTRLYLPLDEGSGTEGAGHPAELAAELEACTWTEGRFGSALELAAPDASVRASAPGLFGSPWSLHLWIRPSARRAGLVASAPGVMELALLDDLRCRLELALPEPLVLTSKEALRVGVWNRVAAVHDGPDLDQVRLIVNEQTIGRLRPRGVDAPGGDQLVLGSDGAGRAAFAGALDDVLLEARGATSAECIEAYTRSPEPGEHVLSLTYPDGTREVRLWAGVLSVPELSVRAEWSTGALAHFLADDGGLRWVPADWSRDRPLDAPLPRTTHPTVFLGSHQAFVFGGETRDSHLDPMVNTNDTWIYHIDEQRWEEVRSARAPIPRCHQPAAYSPDHDVVLYFGGWRNDRRHEPAPEGVEVPAGQLFKDTWLFDCARREWRQIRIGEKSRPRSDSTVVYHPPSRRFVVYGGGIVSTFDPEREVWEARPAPRVVGPDGAPATAPTGGSTLGGYDPATGLVFLFGTEGPGPDGKNVYGNPTMVYDVEANVLTLRAPDPAPSARVRAGLAHHARLGVFVLFGGVQDQFSQRKSDLWTYDVRADRWTRHEAANAPSARGGYYGMAYDPELDVFVLPFGRHAPQSFLNETWRMRFDPTAEARASYVFDRAAFPELGRLQVDWSGPEESALDVRVELSDDARAWTPLDDPNPRGARFARVVLAGRPDGRGVGPAVRALRFAADDAPPAAGARRVELQLPRVTAE